MVLNFILSPNVSIIAIIIFIAGFIFSIGFHEFSHAKSAQLMGDMTPVYQGRVTLNPFAHLDPVGTLMMFFTFFGWGKPVEVNPENMGAYPERKYFISSIVGPISNIILAIAFFLLIWGFVAISRNLPISSFEFISIYRALLLLFSFNIILAIFNLIPIPPLDGSKIWGVVLPYNARVVIEPFIQKYGIFLLILIAVPIIPVGSDTTSIAGLIISPIVSFFSDVVFRVVG